MWAMPEAGLLDGTMAPSCRTDAGINGPPHKLLSLLVARHVKLRAQLWKNASFKLEGRPHDRDQQRDGNYPNTPADSGAAHKAATHCGHRRTDTHTIQRPVKVPLLSRGTDVQEHCRVRALNVVLANADSIPLRHMPPTRRRQRARTAHPRHGTRDANDLRGPFRNVDADACWSPPGACGRRQRRPCQAARRTPRTHRFHKLRMRPGRGKTAKHVAQQVFHCLAVLEGRRLRERPGRLRARGFCPVAGR